MELEPINACHNKLNAHNIRSHTRIQYVISLFYFTLNDNDTHQNAGERKRKENEEEQQSGGGGGRGGGIHATMIGHLLNDLLW